MKIKNLSIYLLLVLCLFITGCGGKGTKEVSTTNDFESIATSQGFTVYDNMELYTGVNYIVSSKVAAIGDMEIEMVEYIDSEYASKAQENHIESFSLLKTTGALVNKDKGSNYYSYALVSNNRYMISVRVENTLVFCKTLITNKEIVDKILNEIGY